jgi:hypothetical protein
MLLILKFPRTSDITRIQSTFIQHEIESLPICVRLQCRTVAHSKLIKVIFVCESVHCHFRTLELIEYQETLRIRVKQGILSFCSCLTGVFCPNCTYSLDKIQNSDQVSCKISGSVVFDFLTGS